MSWGSSVYYFAEDQMHYPDAMSFCHKFLNGYLLTITSREEQAFVEEQLVSGLGKSTDLCIDIKPIM